jgi:uroporphyrinogen-III synthase
VSERFRSSLAGKRVVITRAAARSEALARELAECGALPVVLPLVSFADPEDFAPFDQALAQMDQFDWLILTSAQTVRALMQRTTDLRLPLAKAWSRLRVACVGPVTAEAARNANLPVAYVAATHHGVALANELGSRVQGAKVLLPRSDHANPDLPVALQRHGAQVTEVIAYRTLRPTEVDQDALKKIANGESDAVLFFSPSAVQQFAELLGAEQIRQLRDKLAITAVGPVTAKALREAGVLDFVVAADTTMASIIEALEQYFSDTPKAAGVKRE